jgi:hypothetical protein
MENEHNDGAVPEDLWDSPEKSADTQSSAGMASAQLGAFADGKFVIVSVGYLNAEQR